MAIFPRSRVASPSTNSSTITDVEFGLVTCRRISGSRYVRLKIKPDGSLLATLPARAALSNVQQLIDESRDELRKIIRTMPVSKVVYRDNMQIGASHVLTITNARTSEPKSRINGQHITVWLPADMPPLANAAQEHIREVVKKALTKEAKSYLPRRLKYLADQFGFTYEKVRFSNAKGRWGSCSSRGTISLNVALMRLPRDVIDYILIHELCHTKNMNHSTEFWNSVEAIVPNYKQLRRTLKQETPYL
jgi:predicted metal-dependent hydrolase